MMTLRCASKWRNGLRATYPANVPRSGVEARDKLRAAALELYALQGYDGTTTAQIAARAGVNHRTFFRHFADKREVLFGGEAQAHRSLTEDVANAPAQARPAEVLLHAFEQAARTLDGEADAAVSRLRIIAANPALQERDLAKGAALTQTLASGLHQRGVPSHLAILLAAMGWAAYQQATARWVGDPSQSLSRHLHTAFADLHEAAASLSS